MTSVRTDLTLDGLAVVRLESEHLRVDVATAVGGRVVSLVEKPGGHEFLCAVTLVHHEHGSTSESPEIFREAFKKSQARFRKIWEDEFGRRYSIADGWQSIMNFATGYAMSTRELLRALDDEGVHTRYAYVYGRGTPFPLEGATRFRGLPPEGDRGPPGAQVAEDRGRVRAGRRL